MAAGENTLELTISRDCFMASLTEHGMDFKREDVRDRYIAKVDAGAHHRVVTVTLTEAQRVAALAFSDTPGGNGGAAVLEEVSVATVREKQQAFFQSIVTGVKRGDVQLNRPERLIFPPPDPLLARPFSAANFALDPVQLWCPLDRYRSLGVRRVPCPNQGWDHADYVVTGGFHGGESLGQRMIRGRCE